MPMERKDLDKVFLDEDLPKMELSDEENEAEMDVKLNTDKKENDAVAYSYKSSKASNYFEENKQFEIDVKIA